MGPEAWKRQIGDDAWNHICAHVENKTIATSYANDIEGYVAGVLTRAAEAGFRAPSVAPKIAPSGTKVLWPSGDEHSRPVLTAAGLARLYALRGHGFLLMRVPQLLKGVAGDLLPRLQEVMAAYEEQCLHDGVDPLPFDWRVFIGGHADFADGSEVNVEAELRNASPETDRSHRKTLTVAGSKAGR